VYKNHFCASASGANSPCLSAHPQEGSEKILEIISQKEVIYIA
jgi:hypothetical protein